MPCLPTKSLRSSPLVSSKRWLFNLSTTSYNVYNVLTVSMTVQRYEKNLKLPNNLTHFNKFLDLTFDISHHISHVCHNGSIENWMAHLNLVKTIPKGFSLFVSKPNVHLEQVIHTDAEEVSIAAARTLKI